MKPGARASAKRKPTAKVAANATAKAAGMPSLKIGLILECGPKGPDQQVLEALIKHLSSDIDVESVTLSNKPTLLRDCGPAAKKLLDQGCARVLVVWDLYPPWRGHGAPPSRDGDREQALSSIDGAGVSRDLIHLICISAELETWLLADGRALSTVLSSKAHPKHIADSKNPERIKNPKQRLIQLFTEHTGSCYLDRLHAVRIAYALPDLSRIQKICSFIRFRERLLGLSSTK